MPASEDYDEDKEETFKVPTSWLEHSKHLLTYWMLAAIILFFDLFSNTVKLSVNIFSNFIGKLKLNKIESFAQGHATNR